MKKGVGKEKAILLYLNPLSLTYQNRSFMLPRAVYLVRYRFKKNKGKYGYFVSASHTKVMKKFREFSSICGEGLKPKSTRMMWLYWLTITLEGFISLKMMGSGLWLCR